ncbi:TonB-dependent receptor domain-containing protein [Sphingomonas sp. DT-207]|uniref:TonB-dependent receptor domain-containing protein n=1 Tax=Sphingomonas sp. DT-207 TaxID=3396167 RepID=UPI003F1A82DE
MLAGSPVLAQRADDNAIADAEDAFGSNDGGEVLGIYNPNSVRGFSPIDAGNVRLEGLYFDRQGDFSPRLVEGNRIRVGASAVSYAFPAPSGIVDYRLRTPGDDAILSGVIQANSWGGALVEIDAALPISDVLSVGAGASFSRSEYPSGNNADITNFAAIAHWQPMRGTDMKLFASRTRIADEDIYPIILGNGVETPDRLTRRRFLGQPWADVETERYTFGAMGRTSIAGFAVRAGLFRSDNEVREGHNIFLRAGPLGTPTDRIVSAYPGRAGVSSSGELGAARMFSTNAFEHRVQLVVRGRAQDRRYGGSVRRAVGFAPFGEADYVARPDFAFSAQSRDRVRQWSIGLDYQVRVSGLGQFSLGAQKVDYSKRVTAPGGPAPESRDRPWLINATATIDLTSQVSLYGSLTRGLEESDVAPEAAANRDEAPPAIRTRQFDAGAKIRAAGMALIAGIFDIQRPYYGVAGSNLFRQLGTVRHTGVEASLSGSPVPGLTLIAGGSLIQARLTGDEVSSGAIGSRPIDVPSRKLVASADWRPPSSSISVDATVEHVGPNTADALNRVRVAPYTTFNVGLRDRFAVGRSTVLFRLQATNLFNAYGWEVAGDNAFVYVQPRQVIARLVMDY